MFLLVRINLYMSVCINTLFSIKGSNTLMEKLFSNYKITTTFFNVLKADDKALESAITGNTKVKLIHVALLLAFCFKFQLIWVDTPCNPTIELFDIQKLSAVAHKKVKCIIIRTYHC